MGLLAVNNDNAPSQQHVEQKVNSTEQSALSGWLESYKVINSRKPTMQTKVYIL